MSALELQVLLKNALAEVLGIDAAQIGTDVALSEYGLDSLLALRLAGKLEAPLGRAIDLEWLYDYPTVGSLAAFLHALAGAAPAR